MAQIVKAVGSKDEENSKSIRTYQRKALYLYQNMKYICHTYCSVDSNNKNITNEDSLIRFEIDDGTSQPDKCDRGVKVLGTLPVIPIGDTRVGYNTKTNSIIYMRDINRFKMVSLLQKENDPEKARRKIRIFTIESKSDVMDNLELDKSIESMGFGAAWTRVIRARPKREPEYAPNTKNADSYLRAPSMLKDVSAENSASAVATQHAQKHDLAQAFKDTNVEALNRTEEWLRCSASHVSDLSSRTTKMEERLAANTALITSRLAQCDAFMPLKRAREVLSRLVIDSTANEYFIQYIKEQGLGKKSLADVTAGATRVPPHTTVFIIDEKQRITQVCETSSEVNVFTVNEKFHFIEGEFDL